MSLSFHLEFFDHLLFPLQLHLLVYLDHLLILQTTIPDQSPLILFILLHLLPHLPHLSFFLLLHLTNHLLLPVQLLGLNVMNPMRKLMVFKQIDFVSSGHEGHLHEVLHVF